MPNLPRLIVPLGLQSKDFMRGMKDATRGTRGLERGTDTLGKSLRSLKRIAIGAFAGWGVQAVIRSTTGSFMEFETALARVGNVSKENLDIVKNKIREMDASLGTSIELVKGYYQVISAGVTDPVKSIELLTQASKLGIESNVEQGDAVKGLAALMGGYAEEIKTASDAADTLYTIERLGITNVGELIPLIGDLSNLTKAAGLSADEMAAGLAQITTTGAGTAIAVTQMRSLMVSLSKGFERLPDSIQDFGSAAEAVKQIGFEGILKAITEETEGNTTALTKMLGRQEAVLAFLQLSKGGFSEYAKKLVEMKDKTGAAEDAWSRYLKTLGATWKRLKNIITNHAILIGEKLAPSIQKMAKSMANWIESIKAEDVAAVLEGVAAGAELFASAMLGIGSALSTTVKFWNEFRKNQFKWEEKDNPKVKVEFLGEGSTVMPLSEKIDEMTMQINKFIEKTSKKSAKVTIKISTKDLKAIKKRYDELPRLSEDAWQEMQDNAEDAFKMEIEASNIAKEEQADIDIERIESNEDMLAEMQENAKKAFEADVKFAQTAADEKEKINKGFVGGIKDGLDDLIRNQKTWADQGKALAADFASDASSSMADFIDPMKDDFGDVEALWKSLLDSMTSSLAKAVSDWIVQWALAKSAKAAAAILDAIAYSGGAWAVEGDQLAYLHDKEMVIPADVAGRIRGDGAGGGGISPTPSGGQMSDAQKEAALSSFKSAALTAATGDWMGASRALLGKFTVEQSTLGLGLTGNWASIGEFLGKLSGAFFGGTPGAIVGAIGGSVLADAIGDITNTRENEALRDALEDAFGRVAGARAYAKGQAAGGGYTGGGWDYGGYEGEGASGGGPGGDFAGGYGEDSETGLKGGIFSGPDSGYPVTMHGDEAIVPLPDGKSIPVKMKDKKQPMNINLHLDGKVIAKWLLDYTESGRKAVDSRGIVYR